MGNGWPKRSKPAGIKSVEIRCRHSDDIPGLVAQGRTIAETLEIARDVARKLIEARLERQGVVGDVGDVGVISFIKECVYFSCF